MKLSLKADKLRRELNEIKDLHEMVESYDADFYNKIFPMDPDGLIIERIESLIEQYQTRIILLDRWRLQEYNEHVRITNEMP